MNRSQFIYGLALYYDMVFTKKVYTILGLHFNPMIERMKCIFSTERNLRFVQLNLQSLLVTIFVESRPQFLVHTVHSPNYIVHQFF